MSTGRPLRINPGQRTMLREFVAAHPGLTRPELIAAADRVRMRMLIADGLTEVRDRSLARQDEAGRYWPA
ncbi:hypothetical protein [Streptomyces cellulosae]|uniref:hypothetical protein n=1 Tax=Streptomyces cellulosae TaxID=1968 RepID=UPI0004C7FC3C|nr:hypothetical protein [Streptomyces cellulosae]